MARPLLPPRGVFYPTTILYDKNLSPAVRDTWAQLYGLAWGQKVTPELTMTLLVDVTGKSPSTLYGHMSTLKARGALRMLPVNAGSFRISFEALASELPEDQPAGDSENLESAYLLTPLINISTNVNEGIKEQPFQNSGILENQKTGKGKGKPRDPLLDHPAVKAYRGVMHLTANDTQRQALSRVDNYPLWQETLEHWKMHGWRPNNVSGILDLYDKGGPAGCLCKRTNGNGAGPKKLPKRVTGALDRIEAELNDGNY